MLIGDEIYFDGKFGLIEKVDGDYIDIVDTDNPEITASRVDKADCITMDCYWTGSAKSESGIQY